MLSTNNEFETPASFLPLLQSQKMQFECEKLLYNLLYYQIKERDPLQDQLSSTIQQLHNLIKSLKISFEQSLIVAMLPLIEADRGTNYTEQEKIFVNEYLIKNIKEVECYFNKAIVSQEPAHKNDSRYSFVAESCKHLLVNNIEEYLHHSLSNYLIPQSFFVTDNRMKCWATSQINGFYKEMEQLSNKQKNNIQKEESKHKKHQRTKIKNSIMKLFSCHSHSTDHRSEMRARNGM